MRRTMAFAMRIALTVVLVGGVASAGGELESVDTTQRTCPPCRQSLEHYGKILHVTHEGKRVYVCCTGCAAKMQVDWEGYVSIMAELEEEPEAVAVAGDGDAGREPVVSNPEGRGVCEVCMGGACELPEHKPRR